MTINTQITSTLKNNFKIIMLMLFKLNDTETKYNNIKQKCFVIINKLTKIRRLIMKNAWNFFCYIDHYALNFIITKKTTNYEKFATWQNRLKKYNIKIIHKSFIELIIEKTNKLNRFFLKLTIKYKMTNTKKLMIDAITSIEWIQTTLFRKLNNQINEKWNKYNLWKRFRNIITYLKFEMNVFEKLSRQTQMTTINPAKQYSIKFKKTLLIYHENDEQKLSYFINKQIDLMLQHLHNNYNHFNYLITLNCLKNEKYWFTRTQNVMTWCKFCETYQSNFNKMSKTKIRHFFIFESMTMIELNFLKSIKSSYLITKTKYILLKINYFNCFVWTKTYQRNIIMSIINLLTNHVISIFE